MSEYYFRRLIETGHIQRMRGRELLTLIVLLSSSGPGLWFKFPFWELAEKTGQQRQTLSKAIGDLVRRGLLEYIPGHHRGKVSTFRICSLS